jgi:putative DeoR family transcriptional regulator (stage III sporulation protein D)
MKYVFLFMPYGEPAPSLKNSISVSRPTYICCKEIRLESQSQRNAQIYEGGEVYNMKDYIEERVLELARYILETSSTVRAAAKKFRVSKSTVHKDITERLLEINPGLAHEVKTVLDNNKAERHIRGGLATQQKYKGR